MCIQDLYIDLTTVRNPDRRPEYRPHYDRPGHDYRPNRPNRPDFNNGHGRPDNHGKPNGGRPDRPRGDRN